MAWDDGKFIGKMSAWKFESWKAPYSKFALHQGGVDLPKRLHLFPKNSVSVVQLDDSDVFECAVRIINGDNKEKVEKKILDIKKPGIL